VNFDPAQQLYSIGKEIPMKIKKVENAEEGNGKDIESESSRMIVSSSSMPLESRLHPKSRNTVIQQCLVL
jgi:hypothetical protein